MSLLDMFNGLDDPRMVGLLAMASGMSQPDQRIPGRTPFGLALNNGMMAGAQAFQTAKRAKTDEELKREEIALKRMLATSEVEKNTLERQKMEVLIAEAARKQQLAQQQQQFFASLGQPVTGPQAASAAGGPTNAAAELVGRPMPFPPDMAQRAAALGIELDKVKAIVESQNWGRPEVARTLDTIDEQGRPVTLKEDKFGGRIGSPMGQWKAPMSMGLGNRNALVDPVSGGERASFAIGQSPDSAASVAATLRGQNMTAGTAAQRLEFDRSQTGKPVMHDGSWYYPPTFSQPGGAMVTPPGQNPPKGSAALAQKNAGAALQLVDKADKLLPDATGSYFGAGLDTAGQVFGKSTKGAQTIAELKLIEAGLIMNMPRLEGPQSDKDTMLYRQAAGQIGDPTIPIQTKQAAVGVMREILERNAGITPKTAVTPGTVLRFDAQGNLQK